MLCESVTRNVVKKPNSTCWASVVFTTMKPISNVAMKQTIESNAEVSKARTISRLHSSVLRSHLSQTNPNPDADDSPDEREEHPRQRECRSPPECRHRVSKSRAHDHAEPYQFLRHDLRRYVITDVMRRLG